jgi:hypothetical protein
MALTSMNAKRDAILWGIYDEGARARAAGRPRESNRFAKSQGGIFFTTWDDGWLEEAIADLEFDNGWRAS